MADHSDVKQIVKNRPDYTRHCMGACFWNTSWQECFIKIHSTKPGHNRLAGTDKRASRPGMIKNRSRTIPRIRTRATAIAEQLFREICAPQVADLYEKTSHTFQAHTAKKKWI